MHTHIDWLQQVTEDAEDAEELAAAICVSFFKVRPQTNQDIVDTDGTELDEMGVLWKGG